MSNQFIELEKKELLEATVNHLDTVLTLLATLDTKKQLDHITSSVYDSVVGAHGTLLAYNKLDERRLTRIK